LGTNYVALQDWLNAAAAYDHARQLGLPWRMTWYQFGWFVAYLRTGRYDDVLALADATIKVTPDIEEMFSTKAWRWRRWATWDMGRIRAWLMLSAWSVKNRMPPGAGHWNMIMPARPGLILGKRIRRPNGSRCGRCAC
jgi:hypothetical protein